jgi:hypothetical protein
LFRIVSVKKVKKRSDALSLQSTIATGIGVVAGEKISRSDFPLSASTQLTPTPVGLGSHNVLLHYADFIHAVHEQQVVGG